MDEIDELDRWLSTKMTMLAILIASMLDFF